jgi:hypothetical protein
MTIAPSAQFVRRNRTVTQAIQTTGGMDAAITETVLIKNDLSGLTAEQRVNYYGVVCKSLGLNPLTQPFSYLTLNGKLVLYAKRDCTDQLRKINGISIVKLEREQVGDVYSVTAYARTTNGREDSSIGAVFVGAKKGEDFANAMMKAETKAKRRVTLSISGLGMLDETEVETIADARPAPYVAPAPAQIPATNGHKPDTWAAKVAALDASDTHREALKTTYGDLFAIVTAASEGIAPYAIPPANRGEALARCKDMAVVADKAQQEAAQ